MTNPVWLCQADESHPDRSQLPIAHVVWLWASYPVWPKKWDVMRFMHMDEYLILPCMFGSRCNFNPWFRYVASCINWGRSWYCERHNFFLWHKPCRFVLNMSPFLLLKAKGLIYFPWIVNWSSYFPSNVIHHREESHIKRSRVFGV